MHTSKLFLVLVLLAVTSAASRDKTKSKLLQENLEQVNSFPCKEPQNRAIRLNTLSTLPVALYMPSVTVLQLCGDGAGCCMEVGFVCAPLAKEQVTRVFRASKMQPDGHITISLMTLNFTQHTSCGCKKQEEADEVFQIQI